MKRNTQTFIRSFSRRQSSVLSSCMCVCVLCSSTFYLTNLLNSIPSKLQCISLQPAQTSTKKNKTLNFLCKHIFGIHVLCLCFIAFHSVPQKKTVPEYKRSTQCILTWHTRTRAYLFYRKINSVWHSMLISLVLLFVRV